MEAEGGQRRMGPRGASKEGAILLVLADVPGILQYRVEVNNTRVGCRRLASLSRSSS